MELESVQIDREHEKKKNMALEAKVKALEEQLKVARTTHPISNTFSTTVSNTCSRSWRN